MSEVDPSKSTAPPSGGLDGYKSAPTAPVRSSAPAKPQSSLSIWSVALSGALLGGMMVLIAVYQLIGFERTQTIVQQTPLPSLQRSTDGKSFEFSPGDVYKRYGPGVVAISAVGGSGESSGSGFVISKSGEVVTNAHVVNGAERVAVTFFDGARVEGTVVGTDNSKDLALVKVNPRGLILQPLQLSSVKNVEVGQSVVAIGNPFGLDNTVTSGIVSAIGRRIEAPNGFSIPQVIQTDASINPGNSGGPLLDGRGRVIGINSQIATAAGSKGSIGIGFAVPSDALQASLAQLREGKVTYPYLGIQGATLNDAARARRGLPRGAYVIAVTPGSPADRAGLRAAEGDGEIGGDMVIYANGSRVVSMEELSGIIDALRPGDTLKMTVLRGGEKIDVPVVLAERPNVPSARSRG